MVELVVFSTIGVRSAAEQLFAQFDKVSGHKLVVTWGTAPMLVRRIEDGDTADVVVLSRAGIEALQKQGKITPGTDTTLASSGVGIAVKAGAPKPDISTAEALKRIPNPIFPRQRRSSARCSAPDRSPTASRPRAAPAAFISPNCSSAWASPK